MTTRRSRYLPALPALAVLLVLSGLQPARAGVFDDDEARRQVRDLSAQTNERLDTLTKGQFDLVNQIQSLREENARLRGQVETLTFELESAKKRQQDFYIDLDGRLRKLETQPAAADGGEGKPADEAKPAEPVKKVVDPAAESRDYEAALNFFKANRIKEAAAAFESFGRNYPDSTLAPNAQYWLGNAYYTLRDCKKSIDAYRVVVAKWPQHAKASDSLIGVATCQHDIGDAKGAKATYESILAKYPGSSAAATAKQRIKK
ncbi:tol-pal system protein YbgF [Propionivibrio dicarboxylicus]|uniref:Cell division coordinator CpoB n=1 Tax=Propionivibrio dicarboxylicus TaxID=83767 RepID=A0A1G8LFJ8_9RHOO|nr:tol-pal system protein YbgF [Propionivibrio dicarboxylicus]SDI54449.1 tol-pal system protein YbgF [Propionivibrio dicarboxylicus]